MKVGYLTEAEIETSALRTLASYERRFEEVPAPPVPVEEILECDLELDFGLEDLAAAGFGEDALGALWAAERRVRVDSSLDPDEFPRKEGRYRFTVAHEIGHWQLHRHRFLLGVNQDPLFGSSSEPSVVCRAGYAKKPPIEWQADAFASRLLMPKGMVARAWEVQHGADPHFVGGQATASPSRHGLRFRADPADEVTGAMAAMFGVSSQAMGIRLRDLGLIRHHGKEESMFG